MAIVNPYLNLPGTAEAAFTLYKKVFGGEYMIVRYKDTPEAAENGKGFGEKAMHIALPISKTNVLMATDVVGKMADDYKAGNDFFLSVHAESVAEADRVFAALAEGGTVTMPQEKTFWGSYFGMLTDAYGVKWMVSYDEPREQ